MKKVVVLSGAGISAESGIPTFRDSGGLWEGFDISEVATPEGWRKNPELVLDFYNQRRRAAMNAKPNKGHIILAEMEKDFDVTIVTQNIDNLHEQAGSSHVIHLHGELFKSRSTADKNLVYPIDGWELNPGDQCEKGSQLRPHVVWFGERVPMMGPATDEVAQADIFIVVGTSLLVYPAAGLLDYTPHDALVYLVDPKTPNIQSVRNLTIFEEQASSGLEKVRDDLNRRFSGQS